MTESGSIDSLQSLRETLATKKSGVIKLRPKVVFQMVENRFSQVPNYTLPIPSSKIGSVTTLEASVICSLIYLLEPKVLFEFGTFLGYTTSILLNNAKSEAEIYSIDLPIESNIKAFQNQNVDWELIKRDDSYNDNYLTNLAMSTGEYYLIPYIGSSSLKLIKEDSRHFLPEKLRLLGNTDLIFLDGGHTEDIVASDTKKALDMLSNGGILIWHDFTSSIHTKVTDLVYDYAQENLVVWIENSLLAFTCKDMKTLESLVSVRD